MPCVYVFLIPMGRARDAVCLRFPHFYGQGIRCRVSMFSSFLRADPVMPCVYVFLISMGRSRDAVCLCFPHSYGQIP